MIDYPRLQLASRLAPIASIAIGYINANRSALEPLVNGTNAEPYSLDIASLKAGLVTLNAPQVVRDAVTAGASLLSYRYTFLDTVELPVGLDPAVLDALVTAKVASATSGINAALAGKMDKNIYDADNDGNVDAQAQQSNEYNFDVPQLDWTIAHNLGKRCTVVLLDGSGVEFFSEITYSDLNTVIIRHAIPTSGKAILQ